LALDYLEAHGWCQGAFARKANGVKHNGEEPLTGRESVCLDGALLVGAKLSGEFDQFYSAPGEKRDRWQRAASAIEKQIGGLGIWEWNDDPERTVDEVKEVLRKAIEAERAS
jgi:hypothetical protein